MQDFSQRVLLWYVKHGRKQFPWQQSVSSYRTWISEIMLQQTQVSTVIPYFNRFIARFPDITTLANAEQDEVLAYWAGLGYYSRARNLHKAAKIISDDYRGIFPQILEEVMALPGIGRSTAAAILSLSQNQCHAILDGNVKRLLSRHQMIEGIPNQASTLNKQWTIAESLLPKTQCAAYTQAMMDLGSLICKRSRPECEICPVQDDCQAYQKDCVDQYPNKKPKKILPEKHSSMLVITDGQRVLLEKRPSKGIWGGLWSLPEMNNSDIENSRTDSLDIDNDKIKSFLSEKSLAIIKQTTAKPYLHSFTHYRLHIQPIIIRVNYLPNGFDKDQRQSMAIPTPIKRILTML